MVYRYGSNPRGCLFRPRRFLRSRWGLPSLFRRPELSGHDVDTPRGSLLRAQEETFILRCIATTYAILAPRYRVRSVYLPHAWGRMAARMPRKTRPRLRRIDRLFLRLGRPRDPAEWADRHQLRCRSRRSACVQCASRIARRDDSRLSVATDRGTYDGRAGEQVLRLCPRSGSRVGGR